MGLRNQAELISRKRVIIALVSGAILGAVIITTDYSVALFGRLGSEHFFKYGASKAGWVFTVSFMVWGIGLIAIGAPVWLLLHKVKLRTWKVVVLIGFGLPFIVAFFLSTGFLTGNREGWSSYSQGGQQWMDGSLTAFGWKMAAWNSAVLGFSGAAVALLVWYLAYARTGPKGPNE